MNWFEDGRSDTPMCKVCANCKNDYIDGDRYCRFCGAPMGEPEFIMDTFACIYGPRPTERLHKCRKCGYEWKTFEMIDKQEWCPECGGRAPAAKEKKKWKFFS